jgi:hypothetical protein
MLRGLLLTRERSCAGVGYEIPPIRPAVAHNDVLVDANGIPVLIDDFSSCLPANRWLGGKRQDDYTASEVEQRP